MAIVGAEPHLHHNLLYRDRCFLLFPRTSFPETERTIRSGRWRFRRSECGTGYQRRLTGSRDSLKTAIVPDKRPEMRASLKRNFYPLPDAVLGLYVLCIARQYLWLLGGSLAKNVAAWTASAILAGLIVWLWSAKRGSGWEGTKSTLGAGWHAWRESRSHAHGS